MNKNKIDGRHRRSIESKKKILHSARKVFKEFGYEKTTIKMIIKDANIGYGTAYNHYKSGKDEIFTYLMKDDMSKFYAIADTQFSPKDTKEAYEIIKQQVTEFLNLAIKYSSMLKVFWEAMGKSPLVHETWQEILNEFQVRITQDVKYSQSQKLARGLNAEIAAGTLLFTAEHYLWKIALDEISISVNDIAENIVETYMFGLYKTNPHL